MKKFALATKSYYSVFIFIPRFGAQFRVKHWGASSHNHYCAQSNVQLPTSNMLSRY